MPEPSHGKTIACDVAAAPDMHMAKDDSDDDDDNDVDDFINTGGDEGFFMPTVEEAYGRGIDARDPAGPSTCTEPLVFSSQETPPAGAEDPQANPTTIFSPS